MYRRRLMRGICLGLLPGPLPEDASDASREASGDSQTKSRVSTKRLSPCSSSREITRTPNRSPGSERAELQREWECERCPRISDRASTVGAPTPKGSSGTPRGAGRATSCRTSFARVAETKSNAGTPADPSLARLDMFREGLTGPEIGMRKEKKTLSLGTRLRKCSGHRSWVRGEPALSWRMG